jgi:hypothetical protein
MKFLNEPNQTIQPKRKDCRTLWGGGTAASLNLGGTGPRLGLSCCRRITDNRQPRTAPCASARCACSASRGSISIASTAPPGPTSSASTDFSFRTGQLSRRVSRAPSPLRSTGPPTAPPAVLFAPLAHSRCRDRCGRLRGQHCRSGRLDSYLWHNPGTAAAPSRTLRKAGAGQSAEDAATALRGT